MKPMFGPQTQRLLALLADLRGLSPAEVDRVTSAWKQVRGLDRAEAWAQLQRVTTQNERYPILAAASAARRTAMEVARRLRRPDWAFWAAAWDAAAAIAADDWIGSHGDAVPGAPPEQRQVRGPRPSSPASPGAGSPPRWVPVSAFRHENGNLQLAADRPGASDAGTS
jgi:hypothetical protein